VPRRLAVYRASPTGSGGGEGDEFPGCLPLGPPEGKSDEAIDLRHGGDIGGVADAVDASSDRSGGFGAERFCCGGREAFFFGTTFHFAFSAHQVSPTSTTPLAAKGYVVVTANNQTAVGPVQCLSVRGPGAAIVFLQQEWERPARGLCAIGCWGGRRDLGAVRRHLTHASSGSPQARPAQPTARPRTRVRPAGCRREQPRPPRGLHRKSCMSPLIADAIP
jgi:hypothetical protein